MPRGEPPSVADLARVENQDPVELLRREFKTYVEGRNQIERLRLTRERRELLKEKRRLQAQLESNDEKIARVDADLSALDA